MLTPDGPKSPVVASYGAKPWPSEASDDYPDIVATLGDKTRVIAADIQWIVQVRRPNGRWFNRYFCRTKEGLLLYAGRTPELLALPDYFPEQPIINRGPRAPFQGEEDHVEA
jgi:hypothetical protein